MVNKAERDINLPKSVDEKEIVTPKDEGEDEKIWRQSSDVHLNIRLPHGANLQEKFSVTSTLRMVKDYVDSKQTPGLGAYDLAVPYPRKVYSDQGTSKSPMHPTNLEHFTLKASFFMIYDDLCRS